MAAAIHLQPTAPLANRVLLPGDPGRALLLAQTLLEGPKMFNHNRGLWGYTGTAPDGAPLTIQSTGMGGPSTAIVVEELVHLGAETLVRVGTCGALDGALQLGALLIVTGAIAADGASCALGADGVLEPDPQLRERLIAAADERDRGGLIASVDLFYGGEQREQELMSAGALAVEMESATLLASAARHPHVRAASVLIVSDLIVPERARIESEALRESERRAGEVALAALSP